MSIIDSRPTYSRHQKWCNKLRQIWCLNPQLLVQAAFRFFSASFFRWYSASRLSNSLFGTETSSFTNCSKRSYSWLVFFDGGLAFFIRHLPLPLPVLHHQTERLVFLVVLASSNLKPL